MELITDICKYTEKRPSAVTLGKFDGMHIGHNLLFEKILAQKADCCPVIFTFQNLPLKDNVYQSRTRQLLTNEEKLEMAGEKGFSYMISCPFTKELAQMEAEDFVKEILVKQLHVKYLAVGEDFHFGRNRKGDTVLLENIGKHLGFTVEVMKKARFEGKPVSSTRIREEIVKGNLEKAGQMLGYAYFIEGRVIHGRQLGRQLDMPTVNVIPDAGKVLPPNGVYASRILLNGRWYYGISNLGCKPTVNQDGSVLLETHIFDMQKDVYGEAVKITLEHRVRSEKRFENVEELKNQMQKDAGLVKSFFLKQM